MPSAGRINSNLIGPTGASVWIAHESFLAIERKFCPCNRISNPRDDRWRFIMATGRDLTGVATKAAYFCLAAATIVFAAMLLLTGLHP
jgi:hypothetical protein